MAGVSLVTLLLIVWAAVTAAFIVVIVWKSLVGFREADVLILDTVEARQASEQLKIVSQVERLTSWAKVLGIASLALILVVGGLFTYNSLTS